MTDPSSDSQIDPASSADAEAPATLAAASSEEVCPDVDFHEPLETTEALDVLFKDLDRTTIPSIIVGVILLISFFLVEHYANVSEIGIMIFATITGLVLVFGTSELIILGVKGIADKLGWGSYFGGIISSIGAALSELVIVIILLLQGNAAIKAGDIAKGNELILTAIVLILTTVLINMFFLGVAMIFTTRKKHFKLPIELTFLESNLVIGMIAFSFLLMLYGFTEKILELDGVIFSLSFNRVIESVIGFALVIIYFLFLFFLLRRMAARRSIYQPTLSDFFDANDKAAAKATDTPVAVSSLSRKERRQARRQARKAAAAATEACPEEDEHHALISFRRFPWFVILILFGIGVAGVILGGDVLAEGIEKGLEIPQFESIPILAYAVIVGIVSTSPELIVTFRGLTSKNKEIQQIGLINQISAINQTFFILFGFPFILSGLIGIGIPIAIEITVVFGGIFIVAECIHMMILDDKSFDILEGAIITILSIVSLILLFFVE
jgi:hypothetical protein